jgi:uncharacterized protein (DUF2147 family)
MKSTQKALSFLIKSGLCAVLALGTFVSTQAADATGTWSWTNPGRNGGPERKTTLKLKAEGEKLSGTVISMRRDQEVKTEIEKGQVKGNEISFTVTREFNGNKFSQKYTGKITENSIKGKISFERNGESQDRDWEAKRESEKK